MNFLLAVLTHGDNAELLQRTISSFDEMVSPAPTCRLVVQDGPCALPPFSDSEWHCHPIPEQMGFCFATAEMWATASQLAVEQECNHIFHLEADFEFLRPVDLTMLATILDDNADLAQVTLMRDSVNEEERQAGGVMEKHELRGDVFEPQLLLLSGTPIDKDLRTWPTSMGPLPSWAVLTSWLRQRAYFSTNPSLMRTTFILENPWPREYESECEGRFGIDLRQKGFSFGIIGNGEPWVRHIGIRTGKGY